jgi:predicted DNA-binding transcriptional regulator YafY
MPVNRNALIRYKTIDKCLQNRYRRWTLEDLIDACSDTLYEYEGIDKGVSKRSVQADIQIMRSDKLGYNAPIIVVDRKYYTYEDPDYSITNIPLSEHDLGMLYESIEFMKQFQGFSHFQQLDGMVQKLEDHIYAQKTNTKPVIDFEKNENLKGLEYLDRLYKAIINKKAIKIKYQSFKARVPNTFDFHPYLLKEFRNRWFVIGIKKKNEGILNLALDRILEVNDSEKYLIETDFRPEEHFKNAIGVSISENVPVDEVVFFVNHTHAPYIETKPLHPSQKIISRDHFGVTFSIQVQHNYELEKDILGLGEHVKIIKPERLKRKIKERINNALDVYNTEVDERGLKHLKGKLENRGFLILNHVYTKREVRRIRSLIDKSENVDLILEDLRKMLWNHNLQRIIPFMSDENGLSIKKLSPEFGNLDVWSQQRGSLPKMIVAVDHINSAKPFLSVFPGANKSILDETQVSTIVANGIPHNCELNAGGIILYMPLLLKKINGLKKGTKRIQTLNVEFTT